MCIQTRGLVLILATITAAVAYGDEPLQRIAFGSCAKQDKPQPIWDAVCLGQPQLFLFLGDNIYGDTEDMTLLASKWQQLGAQPGYQKLLATCPVLATWDDHDFGADDSGASYPKRRESQQIFQDFFGVPQDDSRRQRDGVYHAQTFGPSGQRVQVILLDTRFFRSDPIRGFEPGEPGEGRRGRYIPNTASNVNVLGGTQWAWLADELLKPAELRIICSSFQAITDEHGSECWGNFPTERQRLFKLIHDTQANGVVILSGDRHLAEIMRLESDEFGIGYPVYEVTSSSLNAASGNLTKAGVRFANEINSHRVGLTYFDTNFGAITIDWEAADPVVRLQVCDEQGGVVLQQRIGLSDIRRHQAK